MVLLRLSISYRLTDTMVPLLLGMYGRDIGSWLIAGWVGNSGLLAMTYEVL